jgi:ribA/ribD-fused uncharacterized protein
MADTITEFSTKTADGWVHSFLSNGFIEPDGSFVEREYQAAKAADPEDAARIMDCAKPFGEDGAKRLGRAVEVRADWEEIKYQTMSHWVMAKFLDHPELAQILLATGDALLIEGNTWHDNTWGNCVCGSRDRPNCVLPGDNWLGQILMTVREALRQTQGATP